MPAHAVCQYRRQQLAAATLARGGRAVTVRLGTNERRVLLVAPRPLARAGCILQTHRYSLRSDNSDQSNSSPQNGTKASWVRPIVITSISSSLTAPVGFLSFIATMLVLERFGTNKNARSTES